MSAQDSPSQPAGAGGLRRLRGRKASNPEGQMPLIEHIRELRNRLFKAALALTAGAIIGWFVYPHVWHFIEAAYCRLNVHSPVAHGTGCHLYVNGLFDSLFLRLKLAIAAGAIISSPVWLYQLWAFLAPGLYARERRWAYFFGGSAIPLFAIGGGIAYFAMSKGLRFLLAMVPKGVIPLITINTYLGYAIAMVLIFGLAFELLLAVPCVGLVELAEIFVWANDRRRARQVSRYAGLSPDEPTPLDLSYLTD